MEASSWDALRKQVTRPSNPTRALLPFAVPWILSVPLLRPRSPAGASLHQENFGILSLPGIWLLSIPREGGIHGRKSEEGRVRGGYCTL